MGAGKKKYKRREIYIPQWKKLGRFKEKKELKPISEEAKRAIEELNKMWSNLKKKKNEQTQQST